MSFDVFLALIGYAIVSSGTPGPNNLMLLASGVNFGMKKTIPHMLGVSGGFCILALCLGFGLGQILEAAPNLFLAVKFAGAAYLVYLAWRIANGGKIKNVEGKGRPMYFIEAAAFQWVNPKAVVMAATAMTVYTNPEAYFVSAIIVATGFSMVNLPCVAIWAGTGSALKQWLSNPVTLRRFNVTMAILLIASLWPMLR